jgi:hypothetical protein
MNEEFKNYTRSAAFNLSLSGAQVDLLLLARKSMADRIVEIRMHRVTRDSLQKKGLIKPKTFKLTEEGYLLSSLLVLAGLEAKEYPL